MSQYTWTFCAQGLPDSETTVMIANAAWLTEPVWVGYHDGELWRTADGAPLDQPADSGEDDAAPTHWMPLPDPPVTGWGDGVGGLAAIDPHTICNFVKNGRVVMESGEHLVTLTLAREASAEPMAVSVLGPDEAMSVANALIASATLAAAREGN